MRSQTEKKGKLLLTLFCSIAVASLVMVLAAPLESYAKQTGQGAILHYYAAQTRQRSFASPREAVEALTDAVKAGNTKELQAIFGPTGGNEVISSGDAIEDRAGRKRYLQAYEAKNALIQEGDAKAILQIGLEEWPFPIPIVKKDEKWFFDTKKGKEELINRRIGRNELNTIQTCLAFVDAQREYAGKDREGDGLLKYAQKFLSTPGKKDGLYWTASAGEEESPLGDFAAKATREGYKKANNNAVPYHGYFFKILKAQGKNAPDGAYDYMVRGKMIGGFAMIAYPSRYGVSGVMTFIVNHDGIVYEKNLGKNTDKIAQAIKLFDSDATWKKVETNNK
jgi:hypothetical protein